MDLLRRFLLGFLLVTTVAKAAPAADAVLFPELSVAGLVHGRFTGFLGSADEPAGPLCENPAEEYLPEAKTAFLLKRLEFTLTDRVADGWVVAAGAAVAGAHAKFKEGYVQYAPDDALRVRTGYFRVPFGMDPQVGSEKMDTVERPIIYGFGNFGWIGGLGFGMVGERDYGLRADYRWDAEFASFSPSVSGGIFMGNGFGVAGRGISQGMVRVSAASAIDLEEIQNDFAVGLSGSWGWNKLVRSQSGRYLPVGSAGDLAANPSAALTPADLAERGRVMVLGCDVTSRMNELTFKFEWAGREVHRGYWTQGYYVTGIYNFGAWGAPDLELVGRWEQASLNYADGVHQPGRYYQAATAGVNWSLGKFWRVQANAIAILIDDRPHQFRGSDLLITQLQLTF